MRREERREHECRGRSGLRPRMCEQKNPNYLPEDLHRNIHQQGPNVVCVQWENQRGKLYRTQGSGKYKIWRKERLQATKTISENILK